MTLKEMLEAIAKELGIKFDGESSEAESDDGESDDESDDEEGS